MRDLKKKSSEAFGKMKGKAVEAKEYVGHKLENLKDKTDELKDRADNEAEKLRIKTDALKKKVEDKVRVIRERRKAKASRYWRMLDDVTVSYKTKRLPS